jgi:hypothetical protein
VAIPVGEKVLNVGALTVTDVGLCLRRIWRAFQQSDFLAVLLQRANRNAPVARTRGSVLYLPSLDDQVTNSPGSTGVRVVALDVEEEAPNLRSFLACETDARSRAVDRLAGNKGQPRGTRNREPKRAGRAFTLLREAGGRFGQRHATHFFDDTVLGCPPGWPRPRCRRAVAIRASCDDKYQNQDAAAVHQASHSTPEHSLRLPFLKKRLVSTVFDEVEDCLFVADGHRAVGSWARR